MKLSRILAIAGVAYFPFLSAAEISSSLITQQRKELTRILEVPGVKGRIIEVRASDYNGETRSAAEHIEGLFLELWDVPSKPIPSTANPPAGFLTSPTFLQRIRDLLKENSVGLLMYPWTPIHDQAVITGSQGLFMPPPFADFDSVAELVLAPQLGHFPTNGFLIIRPFITEDGLVHEEAHVREFAAGKNVERANLTNRLVENGDIAPKDARLVASFLNEANAFRKQYEFLHSMDTDSQIGIFSRDAQTSQFIQRFEVIDLAEYQKQQLSWLTQTFQNGYLWPLADVLDRYRIHPKKLELLFAELKSNLPAEGFASFGALEHEFSKGKCARVLEGAVAINQLERASSNRRVTDASRDKFALDAL